MSKNPVGRPKRLKSVEPAETRARMLETAEKLLEGRGYAGVSMDEVARHVGITKSTIYHHFPGGKDALILGVGHQMLQRHQHGIRAAIDSASTPSGQLEAIARWIFEGTGQADRMLREAGAFLPASHLAEIFEGFMLSLFLPIESVFKAGIANGDFRPHDTNFMTSTFLTLLTGYEEHRHHVPASELARQLLDFVLHGISSQS